MQPKTYLITGAGSGIGRAITQKLAAQNHTCILLGRNESNLVETLEMLPAINHQILVADIRDKAQLAKVASQLNASFIDGILANSGVGGENYWGENDRWDEIINIHWSGFVIPSFELRIFNPTIQSTEHQLKPRILRWRHDKKKEEADTL